MRLQLSHDLLRAMRRPENRRLREMVNILFTNPRPGWVSPVTDVLDTYEFTADDLWVRYRINTTGAETVIEAWVTGRPSFL